MGIKTFYIIGIVAVLIGWVILGRETIKSDGRLSLSVGETLMIISITGASWFGVAIMLLSVFDKLSWWRVPLINITVKAKDGETKEH